MLETTWKNLVETNGEQYKVRTPKRHGIVVFKILQWNFRLNIQATKLAHLPFYRHQQMMFSDRAFSIPDNSGSKAYKQTNRCYVKVNHIIPDCLFPETVCRKHNTDYHRKTYKRINKDRVNEPWLVFVAYTVHAAYNNSSYHMSLYLFILKRYIIYYIAWSF